MGGNGGKPKPGGAQSIKGKGMGGATQVQPAFASVTSVTPGEIAVSLEGTSAADGIALGLDGDAQAATPNAPTTTNNAPVRLNTFDILDPHFRFGGRILPHQTALGSEFVGRQFQVQLS